MKPGHKGVIPANPYADARVLCTKVSPDFHRALRAFAVEKDATVSAVIKAALELYIKTNTH